jgi:glucose/arabinose dehydrogenase
MLTNRVGLFLLLVYTLLVAGCGGREDEDHRGSGATTGTLAVVINQPSGVAAAVRVTGPANFSRDLSQTTTLAGLAPGDYLVTASAVSLSGVSYLPLPATQVAAVRKDASTSAVVNYAARVTSIGLAEVARGLDNPVFLTAPVGDSRRFIVERAGRIRLQDDGDVLPQPFLDIGARVGTAGEGGMLSLAFDPHYASNGFFYVFYSNPQQDIVVERFHAPDGSTRADADSGLVILHIPHLVDNRHYGGQLAFGPDGYLYVSTGDGDGLTSPAGLARDLGNLLGKILRIDVGHASADKPYAIPSSNPYVGASGKRPEIWAAGLRNPWRFSFDGKQLYIADVGQSQREELDIASTSEAGQDYGWDTMEGTACVKDGCDRKGIALPAFEYAHGAQPDSPCAIVGGYVYRGSAIPELAGRYFYSDYCAGFLNSLYASNGKVTEQRGWAVPSIGHVVSFSQDGKGELYLISEKGSIYKIGRMFAPKG